MSSTLRRISEFSTIVPWARHKPSTWKVWKISHAFKHIGSGTTPTSSEEEWFDGEIPWITSGELRETVIMEPLQRVSRRALKYFTALKIHPADSIVIAMYGATIGRVGILGIDATTNQACCAIAFSKVLLNKFVFYWLIGFREEIISWHAVGGGQPNINREKICSLRIPAPTLEQQQNIVDFLEKKIPVIDALILKKQRQIELLQEKRNVLVHRAVTKGLHPTAKMKDSGVQWLGEIPAHWKVVPLRAVLTERREFNDGPKTSNILSVVKDIGVINYNDREASGNKKSDNIEQYKLIYKGDLVLNRMNVIIGSVGIAREFGAASIEYYVLHNADDSSHTEFYGHIFSSRMFQNHLAELGSGILSHRLRIPFESLRKERVPCPPICEQIEIATFLSRTYASIELLVTKLDSSIDLLKEYRCSLIVAAVTGNKRIQPESKTL